MYRKYVYSGTTWFDIVSADTAELLEIARLYNLDDTVVRTIANNNNNSSFINTDNCIVLCMNFPAAVFDKQDESLTVSAHKVSFIIGRDFVISSRFSDTASFKYVKREFRKYNISKELFPTFFLNMVLLFLYQDTIREVTNTIPKKNSKLRNEASKKYLSDFAQILEEHGSLLKKTEQEKDILSVDKVPISAAIDAHTEAMQKIHEQNNVCLDCLSFEKKKGLFNMFSTRRSKA